MIQTSTAYNNAIIAGVRHNTGKVELYKGSASPVTFAHNGDLQEVEIQRTADTNRFFGAVICQRLHVKLRQLTSNIPATGDKMVAYIGNAEQQIGFPSFTITEVNKDEKTGGLSITAYDVLNKAGEYTVNDLELTAPYDLGDVADAIGTKLGVSVQYLNCEDDLFSLSFDEGANFEGTENLREVLTALCEVTQTIAYIDSTNKLTFKAIRPSDSSVLTIRRNDYINLKSKTNRRLVGICSATELGDNVESVLQVSGTTQIIRDNPFWELREDVGTLVEEALERVGNLTINQFELDWRGNPALELGDKITLNLKNGTTASSYVLDDTITFNGSLKEKIQYNYTEDEQTTANPSTLGQALNKTYARVDKANKHIELLASDETNTQTAVSALQITTDGIQQSVSNVEGSLNDANATLQQINGNLNTLEQSVNTKMSATQVDIAIAEALNNGVSKVVTETGFSFDKDGLTISKTGSEMETNIDEDGMSVMRNGTEVLTADNTGVNAINLTARQYLIIGTRSRFEDYGTDRTACFWIG